ncbi:MAG: SCO family protein [Nocardioides sp.]
MGRRLLAAASAALGLVLLAGCGGSASSDAGRLQGITLDQPYVVPSTPLTDTSGAPYSLTKDTTKPLTLVFFGYTHCPDICQVVMATLASAMTRLDSADRARVDVVLVTTDPARDTAPVLKSYLARFDPTFIGLTGSLPTIASIGKPMAVAVEQGKKLPSGGYEVVHNTQVSAIGADDKVHILWTQDTSAATIASDVHLLLEK